MATITFTVTVASGTNAFSTGDKFYINGTVSPVLELQEGNTYIFDTSDTSNANEILSFSSTKDGTHTTGEQNILPALQKQEQQVQLELKQLL